MNRPMLPRIPQLRQMPPLQPLSQAPTLLHLRQLKSLLRKNQAVGSLLQPKAAKQSIKTPVGFDWRPGFTSRRAGQMAGPLSFAVFTDQRQACHMQVKNRR